MTPQELKASILQLAIQGKLVEQRPEEGTGEELLRDILTQRRRDAECAEKKLTQRRGVRGGEAGPSSHVSCPMSSIPSKNISAHSAAPREEIPDSEKPFDIPESWVWVRLGELFQHNTGKALNSADKSGTPLEYITTSNVYWNRFDLGKLKTMCFTDAEVEKCTVQKGDLLVLEGGDIGRAAIWNYDFPMRIQNHIHRLRPYGEVCIEYFYHVFYYLKSVGSINGKGIGIKGLSANVLHSLLIPLPPLAEQKRIVAKIEELLPLIDRYEKAWSKLEDFNKRFPGDMQKSLLQMAIQGKLVDQRPEEGTGEELYRQIQSEKQRLIKSGKIKKEKPLPEITPDEIPFDIPDSWKWVRLGAVLDKLVDGTHRTPKYTTSGVPFVSVRNMSSGVLSLSDTKFISEEEHSELVKRCNPQRGDILLSKVGTTGVPAKVETDEQFSLFVSVALLKFNKALLDIDFLYLTILSPSFQKQCEEHTRGVGNKNWVIVDIANTIFPLPPLAEQKRIVAKLEELLPLCERLKELS